MLRMFLLISILAFDVCGTALLAHQASAAPAVPDALCTATEQPDAIDAQDGDTTFCPPWVDVEGNSLDTADRLDCFIVNSFPQISLPDMQPGIAVSVANPTGVEIADVTFGCTLRPRPPVHSGATGEVGGPVSVTFLVPIPPEAAAPIAPTLHP